MCLAPEQSVAGMASDVWDDFSSLLEENRENFDLIIVDFPARLSVPDYAKVVHLVRNTILISRWNRTPREALKKCASLLRDDGSNVEMVILNGVDVSKSRNFNSWGFQSHPDYYYY